MEQFPKNFSLENCKKRLKKNLSRQVIVSCYCDLIQTWLPFYDRDHDRDKNFSTAPCSKIFMQGLAAKS